MQYKILRNEKYVNIQNSIFILAGYLSGNEHRVLFFDDVLMQVPLLFRTLILSAILVPLMTYVIMPIYTGLFKKWLEKQ
ncbi:hypothetical protein ASD98_12155 [Flavobacterium sp. Root186]|nr:hypothetical protein ASD98_12155 [Flavobacterium sp. Root186]